MTGNLFCHKVSTAEIKAMNYRELRYWNRWYELIQEAVKKGLEG